MLRTICVATTLALCASGSSALPSSASAHSAAPLARRAARICTATEIAGLTGALAAAQKYCSASTAAKMAALTASDDDICACAATLVRLRRWCGCTAAARRRPLLLLLLPPLLALPLLMLLLLLLVLLPLLLLLLQPPGLALFFLAPLRQTADPPPQFAKTSGATNKLAYLDCRLDAAAKDTVKVTFATCFAKSKATNPNAICVNYPSGVEAGCAKAVEWWYKPTNYNRYKSAPDVAGTSKTNPGLKLPAGSSRQAIHDWLHLHTPPKDGCAKPPCEYQVRERCCCCCCCCRPSPLPQTANFHSSPPGQVHRLAAAANQAGDPELLPDDRHRAVRRRAVLVLRRHRHEGRQLQG